LAKAMVAIGEHNGRHTAALVTDMDTPLGFAIGNSMEVTEAIETLHGNGPADFTTVCLELAGGLLELAGLGNFEECHALACEMMNNGKGLAKFREMVRAQGGDVSVIDDPSLFVQASVSDELCALEDGYLAGMDTEQIGISAVLLGAGREKKEDEIDFSAGITLCKKVGDYVKKGDTLAVFYSSDSEKITRAQALYRTALTFSDTAPAQIPLIFAKVTKEKIVRF
ncbi:MAG: thymidine phosphorylase, partial [Pygmaiobacter sp.]